MPETDLRIVIADPNPLRAAILCDGLREAAHVHVVVIDTFLDLETRLRAENPDMVLIDLENPRIAEVARSIPTAAEFFK